MSLPGISAVKTLAPLVVFLAWLPARAAPSGPATAPSHGELRVETTPPGAEVWCDSHPLGTAPVSARLPAGTHVLAIRRGKTHENRVAQIRAGETTVVRVSLPLPADKGAPAPGSARDELPGKTTVIGGLPQEVVGRVVRRHWNEVKYCYEKELATQPGLAGKVVLHFVIGENGDVADAQVRETTLDNPRAEGCMLQQARRWRFPAPVGGGRVEVTYPFVFKSAASPDPDRPDARPRRSRRAEAPADAPAGKDAIGRYIRTRVKSVQQCYEKELASDPSLQGRIVAQFVVTTEGRVRDVVVAEDTLGNDNVVACVRTLLARWTFPLVLEEDEQVAFPFVFKPGR